MKNKREARIIAFIGIYGNLILATTANHSVAQGFFIVLSAVALVWYFYLKIRS